MSWYKTNEPTLEELTARHGLPEAQSVKGWWSLRLIGPDGHLKAEHHTPNIITTTGKNMLAGFFTGGVAGGFAINIAIGTGTTTPVVGNTDMENEVGTRITAGRAITANTAYYSALFTAENPATQQTIAEYGNFSLNAAGYIYSHATAPAIIKETTDTLEVQYRFSFP